MCKATKALQKTLEWRQEFRPDLITWEEVQGCAFRLTLHMFAAQCHGLYVVALHLSVVPVFTKDSYLAVNSTPKLWVRIDHTTCTHAVGPQVKQAGVAGRVQLMKESDTEVSTAYLGSHRLVFGRLKDSIPRKQVVSWLPVNQEIGLIPAAYHNPEANMSKLR